MMYLRQNPFRFALNLLLPAYTRVLMALLIAPLASAVPAQAQHQTPDQMAAHQWAGNWLVVGQRDEQLVWQLNADGTGFAHGFDPAGRLSHGFAIAWRIRGDQVKVRTGGTLHCNRGMVYAQFIGWSPATLTFSVINGRHWRQRNGSVIAFQRRLRQWQTPNHGAKCPSLYDKPKPGEHTASTKH